MKTTVLKAILTVITCGFLTASGSGSENTSSSLSMNESFMFLREDLNQDGVVDLDDILLVENDAAAFVCGNPLTDLNLDGCTDVLDIFLVYNVATTFP